MPATKSKKYETARLARYCTYGLDLVNVKATGDGTSWWAQSVKKCDYSGYVHTDPW